MEKIKLGEDTDFIILWFGSVLPLQGVDIIIKAAKGKKILTLKELEQFIKRKTKETEKLLEKCYLKSNNQLIKDKIIDSKLQKEYKKYANRRDKYIIFAIDLLILGQLIFLIPAILFTINAILCHKITKKLNVLTQVGVDYKEQWKGLKKYMKDFSNIDRREVPELVVWEKYLVYATAFGIADKVIKQLKIIYPNYDEMATYTHMNLMINTNFSKCLSSSIARTISSRYSSGTGGGGGFSGGGGGGRRPEVAEAGR